jgi:hypothetical protein
LLDELLAIQAEMTRSVTTSSPRRRRYRTVAISSVAAAVVAAVLLQVLPGTLNKTPSASAAQFLRRAATTVLSKATASDQSAIIPQPNQYVYSVNEDPNGTLVKTWISVNGANPGRTEWISGIAGEVPATGGNSLTPCTLAQAGSCLPEVGYFPTMPTNPSSLLAYLNTIGFVDSSGFADTSSPGDAANDLAKGVMYLLETAYLLPAQRAALFNLMAATPGFTIVPAMADAIGRMGVGVEWTFAGGSGALIFNSTTYDLLGVRTWPQGAASLNAPYDGNALISISVVNSTT